MSQTLECAFNQYRKSYKTRFIIYADLECLIEKMNGYKNNPENSSTTKVGEHILSSFSMTAMLPFKSKENKHDLYRATDCMQKFFELLREHATKKINFRKEKMKFLIIEQQESYENAKIYYMC